MGLFVKNVCFIGATCWLLYIWATGERMDDLLLAIPLFFVTLIWLMRHGRRKKKLKVTEKEREVIVEEPEVSNSAKNAVDWGGVIFFGLIFAWFVYAYNLEDDTLTPQERQTMCVNQTNIVVGKLIDEALVDPSTAIWQYEYDNIYDYENALRKRILRECLAS